MGLPRYDPTPGPLKDLFLWSLLTAYYLLLAWLLLAHFLARMPTCACWFRTQSDLFEELLYLGAIVVLATGRLALIRTDRAKGWSRTLAPLRRKLFSWFPFADPTIPRRHPSSLRARAGTRARCAWCHTGLYMAACCPECGTLLHAACALEAPRCPTLGCESVVVLRLATP